MNADQMQSAMLNGLAKVYDIPEGATFFPLFKNGYLGVCAHPERAPWLVTHDGREVALPLIPPA